MKTFIRHAVITVVLALLMGAEWWMSSPEISRHTNNLPSKIRAGFNDHELQPWIMGSLLLYVATFLVIQLRQGCKGVAQRRVYCLGAAQGLFCGAYFWQSGEFGSMSTEALVFTGGCALGLAFTFWQGLSTVPGGTRLREVAVILVILLAASSLHTPDDPTEYRYREVTRATGLWRNPNTYGLLMACGFVLSAGLMIQGCVNSAEAERNGRTGWWKRYGFLWWMIPMSFLVTGLLQSMSRGAWLGTGLALLWLAIHFLGGSRARTGFTETGGPVRAIERWFQAHGKTVVVLVAALGVLSFWVFRHAEHPHLRRAFTIGNAADLSWRNRALAYEQALQMMAERPLEGHSVTGWKSVHDTYYQPAPQEDGAAVTLNEYFVLGIGAGLLPLLLFGGGVALALWAQGETADGHSLILRHTAASVIIALLAGFWFDGGLFTLALAVPFWVLLELATGSQGMSGKHHSAPAVTMPSPA